MNIENKFTRRKFVASAATVAGGALLTRLVPTATAAEPGKAAVSTGKTEPFNPGGLGYKPVITPNGVTLPWKMVDGVKVFHLVAEPVTHEFVPAMEDHPSLVAECWGYNGCVHGPTIEGVEGDRVRIYVTNRLSAPTSVHWHGLLLPSGMDGVGGVSQKAIQPGETFKYEYTLKQHGTLMYHSHHDEMTQMQLGMMGLFIIHPKKPAQPPPDRLRVHVERMENRSRRAASRSERDDGLQRVHV